MYLKITRRMELSFLSSSITFSEREPKTKVLSKSIVYHAICYKKKSVTPIEQSFVYLHVLYLSDIHVHVLTPSWKHPLFLEHGLWESRAWTFQWETVTIKWYEVRHRSKVFLWLSLQFSSTLSITTKMQCIHTQTCTLNNLPVFFFPWSFPRRILCTKAEIGHNICAVNLKSKQHVVTIYVLTCTSKCTSFTYSICIQVSKLNNWCSL